MPAPSARIVDAVIDLVAERGMEGVSVRAVAGRAGVSIGAVQHHFPTKEAMLLAANDRIGTVVVERITE
ncbi:MAG: TetR/AcrR family transcriptional regulator, partial [Phycicoccus sp.]